MRNFSLTTVLIIAIGLSLGILGGDFIEAGQNPENKSVEERIEEYNSTELISEDPHLRTFKIEFRDSENATTHTGEMWRFDGVTRGTPFTEPWDEWEGWEGPGNYSTEYKDFGVFIQPDLYGSGSTRLEQEVDVPETGLTVFSVKVSSFKPEIYNRHSWAENVSCSNVNSRLVVEDEERYTSVEAQKVTDEEGVIKAALDEYAGESVTVRYAPTLDECPVGFTQVEEFRVDHYYDKIEDKSGFMTFLGL